MGDAKLGRVNGRYYALWRDDTGTPRRNSLGTTDKAIAEASLAEFNRSRNAQQFLKSGVTVGSIYQAYIEDRREAGKVMPRIEFSWRPLKATFENLHPDQITKELVKSYTEMRRQTVKDGTIHTELGCLRAAMRFAVREKWIASEPFIQLPQKPTPKEHYLTHAQARALLDACTAPHIKLFVILALSTAARRSALLQLTWDRVDFDRRLIDLRKPGHQAHNKRRALVPINDMAIAALQDAKAGAMTNFVIEYSSLPVASVKTGMKAASRRARVYCTPHVLRHTAAVWMAEAGVPMSEIAQYLGHTNTAITEKVYARYSPDYLRRASNALDLTRIAEVQRKVGS